jgi:hypothetical protein
MNIDVLEKIIKSKSHYFIGSLDRITKSNYNDTPNIFLFSVPKKLFRYISPFIQTFVVH